MTANDASSAAHYRYSVAWSPEDEEFVSTVAEFPSLSWLDESKEGALSGLVRMVEALEDAEDVDSFDAAMSDEGENIPWAQAKADLGWE